MSAETAPGPGIFVNLDRPRPLRYKFKAFCRLEREYGMRIGDLLDMIRSWQETPTKMEMTKLAVLLWTGLAADDPALTPEGVEDRIPDFASLKEIIPAISAAIIESMGSGKEDAGKKAQAPRLTIPNGPSRGANT